MRKIGFITDIQYIDNLVPLIQTITITIYDEELNQVVAISPTNFKRTYHYEMLQQVEYTKEDNSIQPYIPRINEGQDLTPEELEFQQKSLLAISNNPQLRYYLSTWYYNTMNMISPPKSPNR